MHSNVTIVTDSPQDFDYYLFTNITWRRKIRMKRDIITIDEHKCTGCGLCIPNCPEGAIQLIDGKARLVSDLYCDGLGACIGECPEGAITIENREAEPYDERRVMENIVRKGENTIKAHLKHLDAHNETELYKEAVRYLEEHGFDPGAYIEKPVFEKPCCPGTQEQTVGTPADTETTGKTTTETTAAAEAPVSRLSHWPVQMHLINPRASSYRESDLLLAADCTAFTVGDFHNTYLQGKTLAIACPKLDSNQQVYLDKLTALIDEAAITSLTVLVMEVPCCSGLWRLAEMAVEKASRSIPLEKIVIGINGEPVG